jgi:hypothetical protein
VGLASTFVPWFPEGPVAPTRLAWLLPLVDEPHRGPGAVMLGDELEGLSPTAGGSHGHCSAAASVRPAPATSRPRSEPRSERRTGDGRRRPSTASCRADAVPLTWAVDPDLVHSVEAMTRPYAVLEGGRRTDRPASDAAAPG